MAIEIPIKLSGVAELRKELKDLQGQIKATDNADQKSALKDRYAEVKEQIKDINDELKEQVSGTQRVKQEIKILTAQFIGAGDAVEKAKIAERIGELKDQIKDANEQAAIFTSGSKYEQVSMAFGQIKDNIMSLDFEGAAEKAKSLSIAAKGITFKDAVGSLKNLGSTFVTLGKTLLTNPLFLIAAAVAGIVYAIFTLLKKLGVLDKAFKAVGDAIKKVWEWIKKAIEIMAYFNPAAAIANWLIKLYEKNEAEKEALELQRKVADEKIKQLKKEEEATGNKFDFEIRKIKASGKETFEAEKEKRAAILETLAAQNDALRVLVQSGKATADQIKVWNENQKKIKQLKQDAVVAEIEAEQRAIKAVQDAEKAKDDARKKANEDAKRYAEQRLAAQRQIQDIELALIEDSLVRELQTNKVKYERLMEDTKKNENLLASEKEQLLLLYEKELNTSNQRILDADKQAQDERIKQEQQAAQQRIIEQRSQANAISQIYLDIKKQQTGDTEFNKLLSLTDEQFALDKSALEFQLEQGLITKEQFAAQEAQMFAGYEAEKTKILEDAEKNRLAIKRATEDAALDLTKNALGAVAANLKEGSKAAKGLAAAQAAIDTYKGAQAAFASTAASPISIAFPAAPYIAAASAVAFGIANIRKILATPEQGASTPSSGGGASRPNLTSGGGQGSATTPSFSLFGQSNDLNTTGASGTRDAQPMVVKAVVSETDVTATQERITKIRQLNEL
jgi:hypothetical protein